jgi:hypothetical protein
MESALIQRQYDNVIAGQYDLDPQNVTGDSLDRALNHLRDAHVMNGILPPLRVLDVGMGTGLFLDRLRRVSDRAIEPHGIDISRQMVALAQQKLPDLVATIDDGANVDRHHNGENFGLVATHFVTGFVPIAHLAPRLFEKLVPGGYWSFVGGTTAGYRELQKRAAHPLLKLLFGGRSPDLQGMICPDNDQDVRKVLMQHGFEIVVSETFEPGLAFPNFESFMEYGYHGGWLTPFIEEVGLHRCSRWQKAVLNRTIFPVRDHHSIVIVLARRPAD